MSEISENEYQVNALVRYGKHLCECSKYLRNYIDENKERLDNSEIYLLNELCNLYFFRSLSIINSLLGGTREEYKIDNRELRNEYEKSDLSVARDIVGDHKGKKQFKKGAWRAPGSYDNIFLRSVNSESILLLEGFMHKAEKETTSRIVSTIQDKSLEKLKDLIEND